MPATSPFAERSVDLRKTSGERVAFRVEFGPILPDERDFCCQVRFRGWGESPPAIRGRDSLEALLLAVGLVHSMLDDFVRRRGRLFWPGTDNDYDLAQFVSSPEWRSAEQIGAQEPPLPVSSLGTSVHRTMDSLPEPGSSGGR